MSEQTTESVAATVYETMNPGRDWSTASNWTRDKTIQIATALLERFPQIKDTP